ncbi:MAG: toxin C-terminal domain-containing protein [Kofleriaceae bacterium]
MGFAESPDLHTAAHEAAHVVQQQAGVQLKGGIDGGKGDPHEEHADAVADKVVRGESAEGLLDTMGPTRGGGSSAVQRKEATETEHTTTNHDFVRENYIKLIGSIMDRVEATPLTQPHARLGWRSDRAKEEIALAIAAHLRAADASVGLARMSQLVHPANLEAIVDEVRRGPEGSRFNAVSFAIGAAFDRPLVASIARMGTRTVVQWDANNGKPVHPSMVVASSPLDRVIGELLVNPEFVVYKAKGKGKGDDTGGKPFEKPLQMVVGEWQGAKDQKLWNWIKVTDPKNATVEDVANTFAGEYGSAQEAYRFSASPPYFGLPVDIALHTDGARDHAPADATKPAKNPDAVVTAAPDALARSESSDDAAIEQAPAAKHGDKPAPDSLKRIGLQLNFIDGQVAPWGANAPLAGAEQFAARRQKEFAASPKSASRWTSALSQQEQTLFATSSELSKFLDDLATSGATPKDRASLGPVTRVIDAYVRTAAISHLGAQSNAALIEARRLKALLPLDLALHQISVARSAVAEQRREEKDVKDLEPNAKSTPADLNDQMQRAADLQLQAAHGEKLDADAVEELGVDASETAMRAKLVTLSTQAHNVMRKADEVGVPQGKSPYGSWSVHMVCEEILKKVNGPSMQQNADKNDHIDGGWHAMLDSAKTLSTSAKDPANGKKKVLEQRRDAIKRVSGLLTRFKDELDVEAFLKWAYQDIKDAMLKALLRDMAIQIGVAVVTGELIGAGFAAVRGIALAGEIGSEIREAGLLYKGAEILTTAAANTGVQGAMGGEMNKQALAENALAMVLTSAALRPFQGLLHDSAAVEGEIRTWGQGAGRVGKVAAELMIDTGASIGAAGVAHAVTHGGQMDEQSAQSWVTMGLTIATQRFVHQRTQAMQHRIVEATRELATKDPGLDALLKKSVTLEIRSATKGKVTPEEAIELLVERRKLLVEERSLYSKDPKASKHLIETKAELEKTGPQFMEVPLQLSHLSPVVEGHIYEGSSQQVHDAFVAADQMGVVIAREWLANESKWRLKSGDRTIEILEKGTHRGADETRSGSTPADAGGADPNGEKVDGVNPGAKASKKAAESKEAPIERPSNKAPELDPTSKVLAKKSVELLGQQHTLTARESKTGEVELWLCSDCARVREKIEEVLANAPAKGPGKSMRARLNKLHERVVELESSLTTAKKHVDAPKELNQIAAHLRDISTKFPSANALCIFCAFEGKVDYDALANLLGFEKIAARSHGQAVYRNGNEFITPDVDMHSGGIWKKATGGERNLTATRRDGTYNEDLSERIGK